MPDGTDKEDELGGRQIVEVDSDFLGDSLPLKDLEEHVSGRVAAANGVVVLYAVERVNNRLGVERSGRVRVRVVHLYVSHTVEQLNYNKIDGRRDKDLQIRDPKIAVLRVGVVDRWCEPSVDAVPKTEGRGVELLLDVVGPLRRGAEGQRVDAARRQHEPQVGDLQAEGQAISIVDDEFRLVFLRRALPLNDQKDQPRANGRLLSNADPEVATAMAKGEACERIHCSHVQRSVQQ